MSQHLPHLQDAIQIASRSITAGGGPFGAVLVTADGTKYLGTDTVLTTWDPTAHAEVNAIREASKRQETYDLSGSVLYSSCQPCPMCLVAAMWARIPRIVYAATAEQAAQAGFDDARFYHQLEGGIETVSDTQIEHLELVDANAPFAAWRRYEGKVSF